MDENQQLPGNPFLSDLINYKNEIRQILCQGSEDFHERELDPSHHFPAEDDSSRLLYKRFLTVAAILHKSHYHISVFSRGLLFYQNLVAVKNPCIDHTVSLYFQKKALGIWHKLCRHREVSLNVFHCKNRLPCGYGSD